MSKKLVTAIVSVLMLATASAAMAQGFDPNLANRYPAYADPIVTQHVTMHSAPVALQKAPQQSEISVDLHDHASSPYAGGGF